MEWLIAQVGLKAARTIVLALLLGGAFSGYVLMNKVTSWWKSHRIESLKDEVDALKGEMGALKEAARKQEEADKAAAAARNRNDQVLPENRARTRARVDRAADADGVQRVRDVSDALGDYATAAHQL